ncbi:hypothetical protein [Nonomuraea sp. NPDC003804]|uniref:hypothetical protein n=1 Tax=Nonomuraea sp. NPDC003804 TaxID=3154547 RepID=UPI0033AA1C34
MRISIHHVRLGAAEFRIVRAADPLTRALLVDQDQYLQMNMDAGAARYVGMLWLLAARSRRSIVYLPLRGGALPSGGPLTGEGPLDLVLLHHSLRFKPHLWKRLRARLGQGAVGRVGILPPDPADDDGIDAATRRRREYRDVFHQRVQAETLFMVGSAKAFRGTADLFFDLVRHGPGHRSAAPWDSHYCTELTGDGVLGRARELHVEYTPRWIG